MQTEILPATPEPRETPAIPAPYPGFEKDMADHDARAQSIKNANATALPGPMRDAFGALKTDVVKEAENLGIKLIPITAGHIAILSEIKSPLIKIVRLYAETQNENERQEKIKEFDEIPDSAAAELLYTFTQPPPALRALLRKGRDIFTENACAEILDKTNPAILQRLLPIATVHYISAYATVVELEPVPTGDGASFPSPAEAKATASAGGLTTSPP